MAPHLRHTVFFINLSSSGRNVPRGMPSLGFRHVWTGRRSSALLTSRLWVEFDTGPAGRRFDGGDRTDGCWKLEVGSFFACDGERTEDVKWVR